MNPEFWLENWKNNKIGFHQQTINPYLTAFWRQLDFAAGSPVFVPLCGKSLDLLWLCQQGHKVLGVEVSDLAVSSFFSENDLTYEKIEKGCFQHYQAEHLAILHGDFFDLTADHLQDVQAVFDRAALVALPFELRQKYAGHLTSILPGKARILLVSFEYDQSQMNGPPFSVTEAEIQALYQDSYDIELLLAQDILDFYPQFKAQGLNFLEEKVYLLQRS
jgi:thiopurine S-methyltransferase